MQKKELSLFIKQAAAEVGFDACGITKAEELTEDAAYLKQWLEDGNNGDMHFLERNFEKRTDPRKLTPGCKSVVVVLLNYFPDKLQNPTAPQVAKYAYSSVDYHYVIKEKLKKLEQQITENYGAEMVSPDYQHSFVDSAPVLERRWAQRAGLGWIGRNKMLIHEGLGSFVFIGVLLINEEAEYDNPTRNRCGSCSRCIDSCPTKALTDRGINATRCISYLTIESKHEIEKEYHSKLSNCVLGCDICADVCPWNKKWSKPHMHKELAADYLQNNENSFLDWNSDDWSELSEEKFNLEFKKSALKRAGFKRIKEVTRILNSQN